MSDDFRTSVNVFYSFCRESMVHAHMEVMVSDWRGSFAGFLTGTTFVRCVCTHASLRDASLETKWVQGKGTSTVHTIG